MPIKVLVAEDDRDVRRLACLILKMDGFEVLSAEDGVAALDAAEGHEIALLVTDVRMPRMDGVTLATRLAKVQPGLKVVYMSGYTDVDIPIDRHCTFLPKPFDATVLSNAVKKLTG